MNLIYGRRGCGKTKRLIKWSAKTGGWILVGTLDRKHFVEGFIKELGYQNKAHVFSAQEFRDYKLKLPIGTKVAVDDVDHYIQATIPRYILESVTYTGKKTRLRGGIKDDEKYNWSTIMERR